MAITTTAPRRCVDRSSQHEQAFDDIPVIEQELGAAGSWPGVFSARGPALAPRAARVEIIDSEARDTADKRVGDRHCIDAPVEARPVQHLDVAVAQPIADPLSGAAGVEAELGRRTREAKLRIAVGILSSHPHGSDVAPYRTSLGTDARMSASSRAKKPSSVRHRSASAASRASLSVSELNAR
jgi:hypothetical protein